MSLEINISAEKIEVKDYGAIFEQKDDGTYSLYAYPWIVSYGERKSGSLKFFIKGILEFHIKGPFLVYKTDEGWYFMMFTCAFWNIDNEDILEKRRSTIPKFMEKSEDVLSMQELKDVNGEIVACIAYARDKKFILFEGKRFYATDVPMYVYDDKGNRHLNYEPSHGEFIEIQNYETIEGFNYSIKVYPSESEEFYIGSILSRSECKQPEVLYTEIINQWKTEFGIYLAVLNTLGKKSLIHVEDGFCPRVIKEGFDGEVYYQSSNLSSTSIAIKEGESCTINKQTSYYTYFLLIEEGAETELCDRIDI